MPDRISDNSRCIVLVFLWGLSRKPEVIATDSSWFWWKICFDISFACIFTRRFFDCGLSDLLVIHSDGKSWLFHFRRSFQFIFLSRSIGKSNFRQATYPFSCVFMHQWIPNRFLCNFYLLSCRLAKEHSCSILVGSQYSVFLLLLFKQSRLVATFHSFTSFYGLIFLYDLCLNCSSYRWDWNSVEKVIDGWWALTTCFAFSFFFFLRLLFCE